MQQVHCDDFCWYFTDRLKELKEKKRRQQEEEELRMKEDEDHTIVPRNEPLKGLEEVRSSASDEGILTPDDSDEEEDNHRRRTRTVESEEWVTPSIGDCLVYLLILYRKLW